MNNISETIGWADLSWNPIKGICPVGCWYCYAAKIYKRFHLKEKLSFDYKELMAPVKYAGPARIFVCSTMEIFHPSVPKLWRDEIFNVITALRSLTFIILTKLPENIDRPMPPNVWLGVSMTGPEDLWRWKELQKHMATVRFISAEPLLTPYTMGAPFPDWLILGRLTGHGKKDDPSLDMLKWIYADCQREKVRLFMKSNLSEIWPWKLIQEFPAISPVNRETNKSHKEAQS